jgi:hypothetical protein
MALRRTRAGIALGLADRNWLKLLDRAVRGSLRARSRATGSRCTGLLAGVAMLAPGFTADLTHEQNSRQECPEQLSAIHEYPPHASAGEAHLRQHVNAIALSSSQVKVSDRLGTILIHHREHREYRENKCFASLCCGSVVPLYSPCTLCVLCGELLTYSHHCTLPL